MVSAAVLFFAAGTYVWVQLALNTHKLFKVIVVSAPIFFFASGTYVLVQFVWHTGKPKTFKGECGLSCHFVLCSRYLHWVKLALNTRKPKVF